MAHRSDVRPERRETQTMPLGPRGVARRRHLALLAGVGLSPCFAFGTAQSQSGAPAWRVATEASSLSVVYVEDGVEARGVFRKFTGVGRFDPQDPASAELSLDIDVRSLQLVDGLRTAFVQSDGWFDSRNFPTATFRLTELSALDAQAGSGRYAAEGVLTIKEREGALRPTFSLKIDQRRAEARGSVDFDRIDFQLGDTTGAFLIDIARTVRVDFAIIAERV